MITNSKNETTVQMLIYNPDVNKVMEEVGEGRGVTALGGRVQWAAMWQKNII
jgi:hypothetical protein